MPISNNNNNQETTNNNEFCNKSKSLLVIYTCSLCEAFGNRSDFITFNGSIRVVFNFVYPFSTNRRMTNKERNHDPCVVVFKSLEFILHSNNPWGICTSFLPGCRLNLKGNIMSKLLIRCSQLWIGYIPVQQMLCVERRWGGDWLKSKQCVMVNVKVSEVGWRLCGAGWTT